MTSSKPVGNETNTAIMRSQSCCESIRKHRCRRLSHDKQDEGEGHDCHSQEDHG
jgi:hypothetical protein